MINPIIKVLHITPHLGGGVGKAVSEQVISCKSSQHTVCSLEKPQNTTFTDKILDCKIPLIIQPSFERLNFEIQNSDIVQVEFWNHPTLIKYLCSQLYEKARWIVWCHTSGLHYPQIPRELANIVQKFIVTSEASRKITYLTKNVRQEFEFISSGIVSKSKKIIRVPKDIFKLAYLSLIHI